MSDCVLEIGFFIILQNQIKEDDKLGMAFKLCITAQEYYDHVIWIIPLVCSEANTMLGNKTKYAILCNAFFTLIKMQFRA